MQAWKILASMRIRADWPDLIARPSVVCTFSSTICATKESQFRMGGNLTHVLVTAVWRKGILPTRDFIPVLLCIIHSIFFSFVACFGLQFWK